MLVHGIWMRGWVDMLPLRLRLRRAGFTTHQFSYPSLTASVEDNADRLWRYMQALGDRPLHLVAHSLGGIIVMTALQRHGSGRVQRIVTLGSPLTGSHVARSPQSRPLLGRVLGASKQGLINGTTLPVGIEVGSIAGTRKFGMGALLATDHQPGDGTVSVAETRPAGLKDQLNLPLSHTGLLLSATAADHSITFLQTGSLVRTNESRTAPGHTRNS